MYIIMKDNVREPKPYGKEPESFASDRLNDAPQGARSIGAITFGNDTRNEKNKETNGEAQLC